MKKLLVLGLIAVVTAACPTGCVNDPTASNAVCPETATSSSECTEVDTASATVVDTATDTAE